MLVAERVTVRARRALAERGGGLVRSRCSSAGRRGWTAAVSVGGIVMVIQGLTTVAVPVCTVTVVVAVSASSSMTLLLETVGVIPVWAEVCTDAETASDGTEGGFKLGAKVLFSITEVVVTEVFRCRNRGGR
jgi:hypothetical protein